MQLFSKKDLLFLNSCDIILNVVNLGVAQLGRALPWGGRGRGFKSRHSDQQKTEKIVDFLGFSLFFSCF